MEYNFLRYVYRLDFPNGMSYFGSAANPWKRWGKDGNGYKDMPVWSAIEEFGWDNVKKTVIIQLNDDLARKVEQFLIRQHKDTCYNCLSNPNWTQAQIDAGKRHNSDYKHVWSINGEVKSGREWCEQYGRGLGTVVKKMERYGMTPYEALTCPSIPSGRYRRDPVGYYQLVGFKYGVDKTSYVVPRSEYPERYAK